MTLKGLAVSAGIGIGTAVVLHRSTGDFGFGIPPRRVPREIERLQKARAAAREQITHSELLEALRREGCTSLVNVRYAMLENDGTITIGLRARRRS